MVKVSIIGIGRVGSTLAYSLISNPLIDELFLYDIIENNTQGTIIDVSHAYPEFSYKLCTGNLSGTEGSKIVIITAGLPRTPEMKTRMDLLEMNKKIIKDIIESMKTNEETILLITTNPVEHITYIAYKLSGLDAKRVIGFSNYLDSQRLRYVISKKTGVPAENINCIVVGEHGEGMIPLFSQCEIDGKPAETFELDEERIMNELRISSKEIINLVGATQFGPAKGIERIVSSILNDLNEVFPMSFFATNSFYGVKDVCISIPVQIGKSGVSEVVELSLNDKEKTHLSLLVENLKRIQENLI